MEAAGEQGEESTEPEAPNLQPEEDRPSTCPSSPTEDGGERRTPIDQAEIFRALEVVERDSVAIAESFTSLFASLRIALSEVIRVFPASDCWIFLISYACNAHS